MGMRARGRSCGGGARALEVPLQKAKSVAAFGTSLAQDLNGSHIPSFALMKIFNVLSDVLDPETLLPTTRGIRFRCFLGSVEPHHTQSHDGQHIKIEYYHQ